MRLPAAPVLLMVLLGMVTTPTPCHSAPSAAYHAKQFKTKKLEDQTYWNNLALEDILKAERVQRNTGVAKNVILFLGDGMSIPTLTAARIYKGQQNGGSGEEASLYFENFPHVGLSKTYNLDRQVSDSASTATAYLCGVKGNDKTLGVDGSVIHKNCSTINDKNKLSSIVQWAQDAGKKTGVVTTTRVTHATPAATYTHVADRDWECDGNIPQEEKTNCPHVLDIASQMVLEEPGRSINVVLGGGYQNFDSAAQETEDDPYSNSWGCVKQIDQNLVDTWKTQKTAAGVKWSFVRTKEELLLVDTSNTDFLLGLFANDHLPYEYLRREKDLNIPTVAQMTETAIKVLQQGDKGYFLLVEGGRIDHAHHSNMAHRALDETIALDEAIQVASSMTDVQDTLIVVTADHAHTMSINGYPSRGQDITGLAALDADGMPYTTLMYTNGPGYTYFVDNDTVSRPLITNEVAQNWNYTQLAAVPLEDETHGGDDVAIYAIGPMSHLFHTLHEQNYIAHVMAHSACIGAYTEGCRGGGDRTSPTATFTSLILALVAPIWLWH